MNNPNDLYRTLLDSVRGGDVVPAPLVRSILTAAGVSEATFLDDLVVGLQLATEEMDRHSEAATRLQSRLALVREGIGDQMHGHVLDYLRHSHAQAAIVTVLDCLGTTEAERSSNYPGSIEGQQ